MVLNPVQFWILVSYRDDLFYHARWRATRVDLCHEYNAASDLLGVLITNAFLYSVFMTRHSAMRIVFLKVQAILQFTNVILSASVGEMYKFWRLWLSLFAFNSHSTSSPRITLPTDTQKELDINGYNISDPSRRKSSPWWWWNYYSESQHYHLCCNFIYPCWLSSSYRGSEFSICSDGT